MAAQPLPEAEEVRELLNGLLGIEMTVRVAHPESIDPEASVVTASYLREDDSIGAVVIADIEVAASAGAALALIPRGVVDECVKSSELTPMLAENFHEVLNVASAWVNGRGAPRVSLGEVTSPGERPLQSVQSAIAKHTERADFEIAIDRYLTGTIRILTA